MTQKTPAAFRSIKEALFLVIKAVITVRLPPREPVPELAYLHREERVHSKIQPVPYVLCTHSEQEPCTISRRLEDLAPVPCCCRGTAMCNWHRRHPRRQGPEWRPRRWPRQRRHPGPLPRSAYV